MSLDPSPYSLPTGPPLPDRTEGPKWKFIILGVTGLTLVFGGYQVFGRRAEKLARMSASGARLTILGGAGAPVSEIDRGESPELYYQVVLRDAPLGGRLQLTCVWLNPAGDVARQNRYRTQIIYKSTWPTRCREHFGPATPAGEWRVRLLIGDRVLSESSFALR